MTIEKANERWVVGCDSCGEYFDLEIDPDDTFQDAVQAAKGIGFKFESYKLPKEGLAGISRRAIHWTHICRECRDSDKSLTLDGIKSMTDLRIEAQESRPYRLGKRAAELGIDRKDNPMQSDSGRERWWLGYDEVIRDSQDSV